MTTKNISLAISILSANLGFSASPPDKHPVIPSELISLIKQTYKIVVLENHIKDAKILFISKIAKDIIELSEAAMMIAPKTGESFHCISFSLTRNYV